MEVVEQTSNKLIIVHRHSKGTRLFGLAGALFCLAVCALFAFFMIKERSGGINTSLIILSFMLLGMLFLAYLCLSTFLSKGTYEFNKEADTFTINERSVHGRKTTTGTISGILSTKLNIDYSSVDTETAPSSEIIIRYSDGSSPKTIICGLGIVDADRQLHQTLETFLKH